MVRITLLKTLEIYKSILDGKLSYDEADRWSYKMMELYDKDELLFEPDSQEDLIWDLINYLYGIDIPRVDEPTRLAFTNEDIIDFLNEKNINISDI